MFSTLTTGSPSIFVREPRNTTSLPKKRSMFEVMSLVESMYATKSPSISYMQYLYGAVERNGEYVLPVYLRMPTSSRGASCRSAVSELHEQSKIAAATHDSIAENNFWGNFIAYTLFIKAFAIASRIAIQARIFLPALSVNCRKISLDFIAAERSFAY